MTLMSFVSDPKMDAVLLELKEHYELRSKAEVIRKAVQLLQFISQNERDDNSVVVCVSEDKHVRLFMR